MHTQTLGHVPHEHVADQAISSCTTVGAGSPDLGVLIGFLHAPHELEADELSLRSLDAGSADLGVLVGFVHDPRS
jgi:hypothetical protein